MPQEGKMSLHNLKDLYIDQLKDLYSAETQIVQALPKMVEKATSDELRTALESHLNQTEGHVERLTQIFEELNEQPMGKVCKGMKGLVAEGDETIGETEKTVRDAGIIASAQRIEHYEMAAYGTARNFAKLLGDDKAVSLLQQTLDEEGEADKKLTKLADSSVNHQARQSAVA